MLHVKTHNGRQLAKVLYAPRVSMKRSHPNRQYCTARVYNMHNGYMYTCI